MAASPPCAADALALLSQGAEARVYSGTFLGRACVVKHRFPKAYRHPVLDARLTRERLMSEARALARARAAGVDVPLLYSVDAPGGVLILERIAGPTVKAWLRGRSSAAASGPFAAAVAAHMGAAIARLHAAGMSHGDLTTSNLILRGLPEDAGEGDDVMIDADQSATMCGEVVVGEAAAAQVEDLDLNWGDDVLLSAGATTTRAEPRGGDGGGAEGCDDEDDDALLGGLHGVGDSDAAPLLVSNATGAPPVSRLPPLPPHATGVVIIDFGLACASGAATVEDCGVDLYVLERALTSAHAKDAKDLLAAALTAYASTYAALAPGGAADARAVAAKFAAVRMRGRKRLAFG